MGSQWTGRKGVAGQAQRGLITSVIGADVRAAQTASNLTAAGRSGAWRTACRSRRLGAAGLPTFRSGRVSAFGELSPRGALG